jgi:hypothetical protein
MTQRRTIGDNPLDSISAPSRPRAKSGARAEEERKATESTTLPTKTAAKEPDPEASRPSPRPRWLRPPFRLRRIRLVGGDVTPGDTRLSPARPGAPCNIRLPSGEIVTLKRDVIRIEVQSEEAARHVGALLAWATAGAFFVGPLGALAGSLYGGRERRSTALDIHLHDGRHVLAVTDPETAQEMQAAVG